MDDNIIIALVGVLASAVIGYFSAQIGVNTALSGLMTELHIVKSNVMGAKGQRGADMRAEQNEEMESAIAEVLMRLKNKEEIGEVLKDVAQKYPRVALKLAKKFTGIGF